MSEPEPKLIALDWGTSSLRAYLLGADGAILAQQGGPWGIMQRADFAAVFDAVTGEWRQRWPHLRAIASGMIGSAQGWAQAAYLPCPAGVGELAQGLTQVPGAALSIVAGVMQPGAAADVMRGEETEIAGVLALRPDLRASARLVLPGTHAKWVSVSDSRITGFTTYMTGELFAVLRQHSILGRFAKEGAVADDGSDAFARGVRAAQARGSGIAPLLFACRALVLTGQLRAEDSLTYLSGLLIGDELRAALAGFDGAPVLVGDAGLCRRYLRALQVFGVASADIIEQAAPVGLWRIAQDAGLAAA